MPAGQDTREGGQISHTDEHSQMLGGGAECSGANSRAPNLGAREA